MGNKRHNATKLICDKPYKATNVIKDKPYNVTNIISNKRNNLKKATNIISDNVTYAVCHLRHLSFMMFVVYDICCSAPVSATNPISDALKNVIINKHLKINE